MGLPDTAAVLEGILVTLLLTDDELLIDPELLADQVTSTVELWVANPLSDTIAVLEGVDEAELLAELELLPDLLTNAEELWEITPLSDTDALLEGIVDTETLAELLADVKGVWATAAEADADTLIDADPEDEELPADDTEETGDALTETLALEDSCLLYTSDAADE